MSAHTGKIGADQIVNEVIKPILISPAVGIREGNDFTCGRADARIARDRQSLVLLVDVAELRVIRSDAASAVCRAIIDQNHFVIRVIEPFQR